ILQKFVITVIIDAITVTNTVIIDKVANQKLQIAAYCINASLSLFIDDLLLCLNFDLSMIFATCE
ncbi:hypothetical protein LOAG_13382, partial [Loa loa]